MRTKRYFGQIISWNDFDEEGVVRLSNGQVHVFQYLNWHDNLTYPSSGRRVVVHLDNHYNVIKIYSLRKVLIRNVVLLLILLPTLASFIPFKIALVIWGIIAIASFIYK